MQTLTAQNGASMMQRNPWDFYKYVLTDLLWIDPVVVTSAELVAQQADDWAGGMIPAQRVLDALGVIGISADKIHEAAVMIGWAADRFDREAYFSGPSMMISGKLHAVALIGIPGLIPHTLCGQGIVGGLPGSVNDIDQDDLCSVCSQILDAEFPGDMIPDWAK